MYLFRLITNIIAFSTISILTLPCLNSQVFDQLLITESNPDTLYAIGGKLYQDNKERLALKFISKAQVEYENLGKTEDALNMSIATSSINYRLGEYLEFKKIIRTIEKFEPALSNFNQETRANLFSALALNNRTIGNIDMAIYYYEKSMELDKLNGNIENQISSYINLGEYSQLNKEIQRAEKYFNAALHLVDSDLENEYQHGQRAAINNFLGSLYQNEGEYSKAIEYFSKNIDRNLQSRSVFSKIKIGALINRAKAHLFLNQYIEMERDLDLAQQLIDNSSLFQFEFKMLDVRASGCIRTEKYENAINLYKKIDHLLFGLYGAEISNIDIMMNDLNLALAYQKINAHKKAILNFQKIVYQITNQKSSKNTLENLKGIDNAPFSYLLLQSLNGYAESQRALYEKMQSIDNLKESYYAYNGAIQSISKIRADYNDYNSKLKLSINSNSIFEKAIEVSLLLFDMEGDVQYLENAFMCSENNRASLLSEAINENRALKNGAIPDTLLEEEKGLRLQIASTNKQLHELKLSNEDNEVKVKELYLFELQNELSRLKKKIEARYPTYFNIKFNQNNFGVKQIQAKLKKQNTVLYEYFIGENNIYIFYLDGDNTNYSSRKLDAQLVSSAQELIKFTSNPPDFSSLANDYQSYIANAYLLFSEFMSPFHKNNDKRILIIPDGFLNYVPFETLITSKPESKTLNFSQKNISYLLNNHKIRYHYSAQLYRATRNNTNKTINSLSAFAPSFGSIKEQSISTCSNQSFLQELKCNAEEIETLKEILPRTITYTDQAASLNSFLTNYKESNILHIASHACINPSDPYFNKIFLADDYLSNNDIFNLDLSTDLVVLSACETGGGKYIKGEGVMSLAKGFLQAGSNSVLMSLWPVDDCITSYQMKTFYENLANGHTKSEALRAAKIHHFETSKKDKMHPYYWSPFVIIGNDDPVNFVVTDNSLVLYSLVSFCAFLLLLFYLKSKL